MQPIDVQPHHLMQVLKAYDKSNLNIDYYDKQMQEHDENIIETIINNPTQKVRIVSGVDHLCEHCPYFSKAPNYNSNLNKNYCDIESKTNSKKVLYAKLFEVKDIVDKNPINSEELLYRIQSAHLHIKVKRFIQKIFNK